VLGRVSIAGSESEIAPGARALVRLRLESPAVLTRLDRFIIRAYSPPVTIGGGVVLDPAPTRAGVRSYEGRTSLERLSTGADSTEGGRDEIEAILAMIGAAGLAGIEQRALVSRAGVAPAAVAALTKVLEGRGVVMAGDRLLAKADLARAGEAILAAVAAFHTAQPMSEGLPREEAREKIFRRADTAVFDRVLGDLKARQALTGTDRLALATHRVTVAGADDRVRTAILDAYRAGGLKPPDAAAVEAAAHAPKAIVDKLTTLLLREKVLVRLDTVLFHAEALEQLKADVAALKASAAGGRATVDVAAFKERYGVSRKFAIPLLEYLDRERVTRRTGDIRLVL
jgi:selenocysteine-specific elongation factor